jgi:hypothetical protein
LQENLINETNEYAIKSRRDKDNNNEEEIVGGLKIIDSPRF